MKTIRLFLIFSYLFGSFYQLSAQAQNIMISDVSNPEEPSIFINPKHPTMIMAAANLHSLYISKDTLNSRYVHLNDTTFSGIVEFCLNVNVDSIRIGETLTPILAKDTNGMMLNVDSMKQIIFYNFWFTSCSPCIAEMPMLDTLVKLYHDKVDFISITWESEDKLKLFLKNNQFNFSHFRVSKKGYLEDIGVVHGYPTTIITFQNKIVYCKYGGQDPNSIYFEAVNKAERARYETILNELVLKNK